MDTDFDELIYDVCKGNAAEMVILKKFDIFEFFDYIDKKNKDG